MTYELKPKFFSLLKLHDVIYHNGHTYKGLGTRYLPEHQ